MRVVTGTARGIRLYSPEGTDVRPTTDKVKESIFNIIQFDVPGSHVLDLFAGSGQLGIEALSRGAACATFVDAAKKSLDLVRKNLEITKLSDNAQIRCSDYALFLSSCNDTFDIIFLDPPYNTDILGKTVKKCDRLLNPNGIIVCEHSTDENIAPPEGDYLQKDYKYGKITLTVFRKQVTD